MPNCTLHNNLTWSNAKSPKSSNPNVFPESLPPLIGGLPMHQLNSGSDSGNPFRLIVLLGLINVQFTFPPLKCESKLMVSFPW